MQINLVHLSQELHKHGIYSEMCRPSRRWLALAIRFEHVRELRSFWIRVSVDGNVIAANGVYLVPPSKDVLNVCMQLALSSDLPRDAVRELGLIECPDWWRYQREAEAKRWENLGWCELPEAENAGIWDDFGQYIWRPGENFKGHAPVMSWNCEFLYDYPLLDLMRVSAQLNDATLSSLRVVLAKSGFVALDWDHPGYLFKPDGALSSGDPESWPVSIFPDGDDHAFIARDYTCGIIAQHDGLVAAFGDQLLDVISSSYDQIFCDHHL